MGGLMQLGITVPDLARHSLYVLGQIGNLILYLEVRGSHKIMSDSYKKWSSISPWVHAM